MKEAKTIQIDMRTQTAPGRQAYRRPTLRVFGRLQLVTQGGSGMDADGGVLMNGGTMMAMGGM
jgi:hypothetical protein